MSEVSPASPVLVAIDNARLRQRSVEAKRRIVS